MNTRRRARFNPLPFHKWQTEMLASMSPDTEMACPDCDGEGIVEKYCDECGHALDEDECHTCDGVGTIRWGDFTDRQKRQHFNVEKYETDLINDAKAFARFTGTTPELLLFGIGLRVWSTPATKALRVDINTTPGMH